MQATQHDATTAWDMVENSHLVAATSSVCACACVAGGGSGLTAALDPPAFVTKHVGHVQTEWNWFGEPHYTLCRPGGGVGLEQALEQQQILTQLSDF